MARSLTNRNAWKAGRVPEAGVCAPPPLPGPSVVPPLEALKNRRLRPGRERFDPAGVSPWRPVRTPPG
jgi:hypothetical protein